MLTVLGHSYPHITSEVFILYTVIYIPLSDSELSMFQDLRVPRYIIERIFNAINWTPQEIKRLEDSVSTGSQYAFCFGPVSIDTFDNVL